MGETVKILLSSIVDYAGLFPPAKLEIEAAMKTYVQHKTESKGWMLGNFVLPVAHLDQFINLISKFSLQRWSLSLLLSKALDKDIQTVNTFKNNLITIKSLEFPLLTPDEIDRVYSYLPTEPELFFEVPLNQNLMSYLEILKGMQNNVKGFAKIRTGGVTPDAFPNIDRLSHFITSCAQINLPFKATAGLHHPLRSKHPVTYESDSATATMHGFLNVVIGAAFLYQRKITPEQVSLLLQENSMQSLQFDDDRIIWKTEENSYELSTLEIQSARQSFFRSFGSCSFAEPVHELKELNLL